MTNFEEVNLLEEIEPAKKHPMLRKCDEINDVY